MAPMENMTEVEWRGGPRDGAKFLVTPTYIHQMEIPVRKGEMSLDSAVDPTSESFTRAVVKIQREGNRFYALWREEASDGR